MDIKLESLNRTYGEVHAVQNISLTIPANTVFGIIGKSGAGKSSLVRLISLLEKPDSGMVYYNNERVDNLDKKQLIAKRRQLGMIFQNFNLFASRTAAKNIAYPLELAGKSKAEIKTRVSELLELVGLSDRANAPISTLSGGQKQRIAIARALATNPKILFCDEATSALDPQTTRAILDLIRKIQKKMNLTVVMITHQMEVVRDACEQVAVLDEGTVVEQGFVSEIFTHPKSSVTKDFISHIGLSTVASETETSKLDSTICEQKKETNNFVRWSKDGGKYILLFMGNKTGEPILSKMAKKIDVEFNIRAGGVQHLTEKDIGTLVVDITGDNTEVQKAIEFLQAENVIVKKANEED